MFDRVIDTFLYHPVQHGFNIGIQPLFQSFSIYNDLQILLVQLARKLPDSFTQVVFKKGIRHHYMGNSPYFPTTFIHQVNYFFKGLSLFFIVELQFRLKSGQVHFGRTHHLAHSVMQVFRNPLPFIFLRFHYCPDGGFLLPHEFRLHGGFLAEFIAFVPGQQEQAG